jgi:hypothetical protein
VVPVTATRYALAQLKLATKIPWYPWYVKKQVSSIQFCSSLDPYDNLQLKQFFCLKRPILAISGWISISSLSFGLEPEIFISLNS